MSELSKLASLVILLSCLYPISFIVKRLLYPFYSPLRHLPGPRSLDPIQGIFKNLKLEDVGRHFETYGKVMKWKTFLCEEALVTSDTRAVGHILSHSYEYQRPERSRFILSQLLGNGILVTEGDQHKKQRRVMNPSFGPSTIRALTPIFFQKANQLRDIWTAELREKGPQTMDIMSWISRATLDVIGLAGFDYKFDALTEGEETNELSKAFSTLFRSSSTNRGATNVLNLIRSSFPALRFLFPKPPPEFIFAKETMDRIGRELLHMRKIGGNGDKEKGTALPDSVRDNLKGRDLLSVLVNANMDTDIPDSQRLTDEEVLAQVPTFLVAGHETTSNELSWCLLTLARYPDIQKRLREELQEIPIDDPTMEELNALPYLDAVVRETMRVHGVVPFTNRRAMQDDVIPLAEPFVDKYGVARKEIRITEGQFILIPAAGINMDKSLWGDDAYSFNPDRWFNLPETVNSIPGVWGHLMTFHGGAKSCIGYRFAVIEMKALLFSLCRSFKFSLSVPAEEFEGLAFGISRPTLKGKGPCLPLVVSLA